MKKHATSPTHTRGPWRVCISTNKDVYGSQEHFAVQQHPETGTGVIVADIETGFGKKVSKANADLIAAAPEMLQRLRELVEDLEGAKQLMLEGGENDSWMRTADGWDCLIDGTNKLIAKAAGKAA